jgi:HD superfamily phosphohydrolase
VPTEGEAALHALAGEINEWVDDRIPPDYPSRFPRLDDEKVIREAVSGYQVLKPHEYLLLDSPVVQRLRYIHQTALAYLVYPTANHTRFDHSLGVAKTADEIGHFLGVKQPQIEELRLAALLHDVGHSFLSHLSENLIAVKFQDDFGDIKKIPLFEDKEPGEILSYLIVDSPRFKRLLQDVLDHYNKTKVNIERVTRLVIGKPKELELFAYLGDIISGPFDADKLDYLVRDCKFTGIRADVDVNRVIMSSEIMKNPKKFKGFQKRLDQEKGFVQELRVFPNRDLIMKSSGASNLEQIVLNKILLFPAIYHHHKVRALECMVKAIFEVIGANPDKKGRNKRLRFDRISDFLKINEFDFFSLGLSDSELAPLFKRLLSRDLLKRCLVLTANYTVEDPELRLHDLLTLKDEYPKREKQEQIRKLRQFIWDELPGQYRTSFHDTSGWIYPSHQILTKMLTTAG